MENKKLRCANGTVENKKIVRFAGETMDSKMCRQEDGEQEYVLVE